MKKLLFCTVLSVLFLSKHLLADCGCCPCCPDWCGFYVGATAGGTTGQTKLSLQIENNIYFDDVNISAVENAGSHRFCLNGFIGGVQGGYNTQCRCLVFGVEADINAFLMCRKRTRTEFYVSAPTITFTFSQKVETNWLATLRPRIGWINGPYLYYATGGLAATNLKFTEHFMDDAAFENSSINRTTAGWTVGAGLEYAFCPCYRLKLEYLYVNFGCKIKKVNPLENVEPTFFNHSIDLKANIVRVGLNYKL